jgi:hypothetical protein
MVRPNNRGDGANFSTRRAVHGRRLDLDARDRWEPGLGKLGSPSAKPLPISTIRSDTGRVTALKQDNEIRCG